MQEERFHKTAGRIDPELGRRVEENLVKRGINTPL